MAIPTNFNSITIEGRLSTSSKCSSTSFVSDQEQYNVCRIRKWRKLLKKVVEESKKSIYGSSKPLIFGYDAMSYSLNFDEGNRIDGCY
ncbi:hypothetical protein OSB04_007340 [Centaurea solstitialis]|uniref:Uncharacterized protein n=1 Tax=Centaurea solstitialis TaxID=347529 RepID=A0AA38TWC8_9ASTR|nr:hypothetical protein OSB04_007340 [Centaurea solstitialis]